MLNANEFSRRTALALLGALPVAASRSEQREQVLEPLAAVPTSRAHRGVAAHDVFAIPGDRLITAEEHFGIINGHLSVGVNHDDVAALSGFFAAPYASSDLLVELRIFGEKVRTERYDWRPNEVRRKGSSGGIDVTTSALLLTGRRAGVLSITLHNGGASARQVPVQFNISGDLGQNDCRASFDFVPNWGFSRPLTKQVKTTRVVEKQRVILHNAAGAVVVATDLDTLTWSPLSSWSFHWNTTIPLAAGEHKTCHLAIALGPRAEAEAICDEWLKDPLSAIQLSREEFATRTEHFLSLLPSFEASNDHLSQFYTRSLSHLLLNRWEVPEFVMSPYYSTGSIKGGCLGCYLWDYGIPAEILPLVDPSGVRAHIRQYLKIDIAKHNRFNPVNGEGEGGTYIVNQEKIIACVYYYVLHTGDVRFLDEQVNGRSILDWTIFHATFGDDLSKPATLVDYGEDVSHLELRHEYKYNHVLPDVNGGRYLSYVRASRLAALAGRRREDIDARPAPLKKLFKETLWSPEHRWFAFRSSDGAMELRYTNIIFMLIGTGVLDRDEELGLISHLNDTEFMSEYGLHSISKLDPAFDQADVDHGGGGSYVAFPAAIAEGLYKGGHAEFAEEILDRTLWWGQRMPYWPDSVVANQIEYRRDTPLQCAIDASAGAQCIIFGMCGVRVEQNGDVVVNPRPPRFSPQINMNGLKIRGHTIDMEAGRGRYEVRVDGRRISGTVGTPVVIPTDASVDTSRR
ncbi:MAG TPA: hypothetical protein VH601_02640 [Bryobacteraceae bacterium]|jgi:hypothetical protein